MGTQPHGNGLLKRAIKMIEVIWRYDDPLKEFASTEQSDDFSLDHGADDFTVSKTEPKTPRCRRFLCHVLQR